MVTLVPTFTFGDLTLTDYPFGVEFGTDLGNPENVVETITARLLSGEIDRVTHVSNREVAIPLLIEGADMAEIAEAERLLHIECQKERNTLQIDPGDGYGATSVFYTFQAEPQFVRNDDEEQALLHRWRLVFKAAPYVRSVDEIITEAEFQPVDGGGDPVTPIDTLVDDCSSTTGWSAVWSGSSVGAIETGSVNNEPAVSFPRLRRTGTIDMTSTPYLVLDAKVGNGGGVPTLSVNGGTGSKPEGSGASPYASAGYTRYYFRSPVTSITQFELSYQFGGSKVGRVYVTEVRKQNSPPASGTLRQKFFTVDVAGSAPSDGTLEVYHDTDSLGQTILYTWPLDGQGFTPALRPFMVSSGPTTADSSLISGGRNDLAATLVRYELPSTQVVAGTYEVGAWLRSNTAATRGLTLALATRSAGATVGYFETTFPVTFAAANTWYYVPLGRFELPLNHVAPDSAATVRVELDARTDSSGIDVDEAYLFNIECGSLTMVDCGTAKRLWVGAATLDWPMPTVMLGSLADGTDSYSAGDAVSAWGVHEAVPPSINSFVVTRTALDSGMRHRAVPAWHTNAGL